MFKYPLVMIRTLASASKASSIAFLIRDKPDARTKETAISIRVAWLMPAISLGRNGSSPPVTKLSFTSAMVKTKVRSEL